MDLMPIPNDLAGAFEHLKAALTAADAYLLRPPEEHALQKLIGNREVISAKLRLAENIQSCIWMIQRMDPQYVQSGKPDANPYLPLAQATNPRRKMRLKS